MLSSPTSCVASNMCAGARNVIIPPPPTPDQLRSIQHVCKCKECYHPPPHPPLTSCVASNMCASARNVIIPDQLRSIQHVCRCKECYHPPPHPPLTSCVASNMYASARNVIISPPPPTPDQLRSIQHVCKMRWNVKMCTKAHGVLWAVGQLLVLFLSTQLTTFKLQKQNHVPPFVLRGDGRECHEAGEAPGIALSPKAKQMQTRKITWIPKNDGLENVSPLHIWLIWLSYDHFRYLCY